MPLINNHVLMSDANNFSVNKPINPYYHNQFVNLKTAVSEHSAITDLLVKAGIKVTKVLSPPDCQDGVYTANWALVKDDKAVLARLPNARKDEEDYAEKILIGLGKKVIHVPDGLKFSGQGDALACGNYLFCGNGYRSDGAAQKFAAETLGYDRVQLQTIPQLDEQGLPVINTASEWADGYFYDIDLALAVIKAPSGNQKGLIAYCPEAFNTQSRSVLSAITDVDKIEVSLEEAKSAFATNLVSTGKVVIMGGQAPQLADKLARHGLTVWSPDSDITELAKGGGFIRCITLTID